MRMSTSMLNQMAVNAILEQQSALSKTQNQLATGQRVQNPADNPVAAVQMLELGGAQAQDTQYVSNGQAANTRLTLEQQALSDATNTLQSARDLIVQANSGANNAADLRAIATQLSSLEGQLQGIGNRQDGQGEYLFSGYAGHTEPFVRGASGAMLYQGDAATRSVSLDAATSVQMGDPGSAVFMNVPTGNGTFSTAASATNTGTGVIDAGSVTDPAAWVAGQYTITFTTASQWAVTNSSGQPVLDAGGNPVTGTYNGSSGSVAFDGIQVGIQGAPAAGDSFTIAPSTTQGVFTTLDQVIGALNGAASNPAARAILTSQLGGTLQQLDQALSQVSAASSGVGARLNLISSLNTSLTSQGTTLQGQISNLGALDYASASSQLSQEYLGLQAAEQSYAQVSQLSLFKYL